MSISERINPDQLNIHQFQETPEGRPELPFDVERDVSPEMKQNIVDYWKKRSLTSLDLACLESLSDIAVLWPEEDLTFISDQQLLEYLKLDEGTEADLLPIRYGYIKILRPNIETGLTPEQEEKIKQQIKEGISFTMWGTIIRNTLNLKYHHAPDQIAEYNDRIQQAKQNNDWQNVARYYTVFKLSDPNNQPQLNGNDWKKFHEELIVKEGMLGTYLALVAHLKVLAAYKVTLDNTVPGGIKFQMYPPENLNQSALQIPETRKY